MAQTPALYYAEGKVIDYTPVAAVAAGEVVLIDTVPCIAPVAIAAGEKGVLAVSGIWQVPQAAEIITAGDAVYWDANGDPYGGTAGSGAATETATGNTCLGKCVETTTATDTYCKVLLNQFLQVATTLGSCTADDITGSDSSLAIAGLSAAQGGAIAIAGGPSSTAANAGGAITLTGGTPGAEGAGGALTLTGGAGGATSGTGGAVAIAGGAGTNGNANGGAVTILGGNANGSGTDGTLGLGTSNTSAITLGAAGIVTYNAGTLRVSHTVTPVAAAGSAVADAGALADVMITHATSDGATKGVKLPAVTTAGVVKIVVNNSSTAAELYAESTGTINGLSADASVVLPATSCVLCISTAAKTWLSFDIAKSAAS